MKQPARIGDTAMLYKYPADVFERLGGRTTEREVTWTCQKCGEVPAKRVANGFLPGKCQCQQAAEERDDRSSAHAEQKRTRRSGL